MATVNILDLNHVRVDGVDCGHLLDAVRNLPLAAADLKAAFDVWYIGRLEHVRDTEANAAATIAAKEAAHAVECAKLNADIEALGTKPEATAIRAAQAVAARAAKREELLAALADLESPDLEPSNMSNSG